MTAQYYSSYVLLLFLFFSLTLYTVIIKKTSPSLQTLCYSITLHCYTTPLKMLKLCHTVTLHVYTALSMLLTSYRILTLHQVVSSSQLCVFSASQLRASRYTITFHHCSTLVTYTSPTHMPCSRTERTYPIGNRTHGVTVRKPSGLAITQRVSFRIYFFSNFHTKSAILVVESQSIISIPHAQLLLILFDAE